MAAKYRGLSEGGTGNAASAEASAVACKRYPLRNSTARTVVISKNIFSITTVRCLREVRCILSDSPRRTLRISSWGRGMRVGIGYDESFCNRDAWNTALLHLHFSVESRILYPHPSHLSRGCLGWIGMDVFHIRELLERSAPECPRSR